MSKVLMIRHLPVALSFQERQQLLKHFGAEKVWQTSERRNYIFASFASIDKAKASLLRLHQLEIANRRLVVEYSLEKEPVIQNYDSEQRSSVTKHIQDFLKALNAWNPSIDFYQPPPVHLKYKYPEITSDIVVNIVHALYTHKPFYTQTLHLMNKMSLELPFRESDEAVVAFKETFRKYFFNEMPIPVPEPEPEPESEIESELSGEETQQKTQPGPTFKRKRKLAVPFKTAAAVLSTASLPKAKKTSHQPTQEEVFETVTPKQGKKISVVVHQDALRKPTEEPDVIGELGKFEKEVQLEQVEEVAEPDLPAITKKELLRNRVSYSDMKVLPVFKNYHPGEPSMRLYIKNLAKTVTDKDVSRIYRLYIEKLSEEKQQGFDVRVMQEGRMKGQAFVTFPSVNIAEKALHETNGYLLKEKPMVVQFARVANKKTID
ncbi:RNA-binding region-containing protein 3-like [Pectinophora gossypiella]|uniref:RNA-binding region-containing protein 3-like n=1 Tax=Pectinophora gossypiella TaxID=13191 RepID=UPI00214EEA32|nr:RNA-binding region-containing protein 3-like [Pectinophora gossypiella]